MVLGVRRGQHSTLFQVSDAPSCCFFPQATEMLKMCLLRTRIGAKFELLKLSFFLTEDLNY